MAKHKGPRQANQLGEVLHAWRTGWRLLPGEPVWFRMAPSPDDEDTYLCELKPQGLGFHNTGNPSRSYVNWWGDHNGAKVTPEMIELVDAFYVYHDLKPITDYTSFLLHAVEGEGLPLVEGTVRIGWENRYQHFDKPTRPERVKLGRAIKVRLAKGRPIGFAKLRFLVLARDNFRCRYCGRTADETELQVDHVIPRSKGGTNTEANLVTACRACNIGKRDALLDQLPSALSPVANQTPPTSVTPPRQLATA